MTCVPGFGPVNTRWYHSRMYSAASRMPIEEIAATIGYRWKVPIMTRNSETNDPRPGSARPDRPDTRNVPASTGVIRCQPP